ncbi:hypothetical protein WMY93_020353 [Mugilogobius chulae]|uniref:Uncharacterized protein n=1 Tax=Mugilogobius chulae TaxID=88201 RepID=A0AAW0NS41_9GOBI
MIWPWQHETDAVDIVTKKKFFDQHMLVSRLNEEKEILIHEMMQHCLNLKNSVASLQALVTAVQKSSGFNGLSEAAASGFLCLLHSQMEDLKKKRKAVLRCYKSVLHCDPGSWIAPEDPEEQMDSIDFLQENSSESDDDSDDI